MPSKGKKTRSRIGDAAVAAFRSLAARAAKPQGKTPKKQRRAVRPAGVPLARGRGGVSDRLSAGLANGFRIPQSYFSLSSGTQRLTDMGDCDSVRVSGSDMSPMLLAGGQGSGTYGLAPTGSSLPLRLVAVGPSRLGPRLGRMAGLYQFYAIRELLITFVPLVGPAVNSSITAVGSAEQIAVGLDMDISDSRSASTSITTISDVMELSPSAVFPAWEGGCIRYKYNGTKVWVDNISGGAGDPDLQDTYQLAMAAIWAQQPLVFPLVVYTHTIHIQYVVDLYRPNPIETTPALSSNLRQLRKEFDLIARRLASAEADDFKESDGPDGPVLVRPEPVTTAGPNSARSRRA